MAPASTFTLSLPWLLLIGIVGMFVYWLWTKTHRPYRKYNIPPFPVTPKPFLGNILALTGDLRERVEEWRKQKGNMFSLDLAGHHNIVISGYEIIQEVLVDNGEKIPNLPSGSATEDLTEVNKGICGAKDGNWKIQRETSLSILHNMTKGKNLLAFKMQEEILEYVDKLIAFNGSPQDVGDVTHASTFNVICSIVTGQRFHRDDKLFVRMQELRRKIIKNSPSPGLLSVYFPSLNSLPGAKSHVKNWEKYKEEFDDIFAKAYIKKIRSNISTRIEPENFIAAYLQEIERKKEKGQSSQLDEENLVAIIRSLFEWGTETIGATILWCMLFMLHHPDIQEKVFREIEANVGLKRVPTLSDQPKLKYLNAVIMETQRLACVEPFGQHREVVKSFVVQGFTFPKGSIVWPNLLSVLNDERTWGDPLTFRPERYFSELDGSLVVPREFLVYSTGLRSCFGDWMAQQELFLYMAILFQRFRFDPIAFTGRLPPLQGDYADMTVSPRPFQLRAVERRNPVSP